MEQIIKSQQDRDLWLWINQYKRKFMQLLVVDLPSETYYEIDPEKIEPDPKAYNEWLQLFLEREVENDQQSQFSTLLKIDNLHNNLNHSNFLFTVMYHNRLDENKNLWRRMWIMLLENDQFGIPKRIILAQEPIFSQSLMQDPNIFNSNLFGAAKFSYDFEAKRINRRFQYIDVNNQALRIFGYTAEEFYEDITLQGGTLICPSDVPNLQSDLNKLEEVGDKQAFCYDIINRDGYLVKIKGEMELCANDQGQKYIQTLFFDNSAHESDKNTVKELTSEIDNIVRTVPGAIHRSLITGKNTVYYVSSLFKELTGYDLNDLIVKFGGNIKGMITDADSVKDFDAAFSRALTQRKPVAVDFKLKTASGDLINVRDWLYITHDQNDKLWLYGYLQDITSEKKLESKAEDHSNLSSNMNALCSFMQEVNAIVTNPKEQDETKREKIITSLSKLAGGTVIVYFANHDRLTATIEYSLGENPLSNNTKIDLRLIEQYFDKDLLEDQNCKIFSNTIILKGKITESEYKLLEQRNSKRIILIPVAINKLNRTNRVVILENSDKWIFQEQVARAISAILNLSYPI